MRLRLYAVLPRGMRAGALPRGLEREPLRLVRSGAFAFAVGEARTLLPPVRTHLLAHDRLVSRIARLSPSILPARFGMMVDDAVRLKVLALDRGSEILDALKLVAGGEQMTLRLVVPPRSPHARKPSTGSGYLRTRAIEARGLDVPEVRAVRLGLQGLVRAEQVGRDSETGVLTLYHLIPRGQAAEYRRQVRKAAPRGQTRVSGPFAPYAFAPATLS